MANAAYIDFNDGSKKPYTADNYADMRGVVDFGNLMQFAPYERGYSFLTVINGAKFMDVDPGDGRKGLQDAFIKILEQEFKGLDGIDDITSETMEISDNITSLGLISKVNQITNNTVTMRFTEKSGTLISKYIATFLRYLKDPRTNATTYGGLAKSQSGMNVNDSANGLEPTRDKEVFNMLYIITDSSTLNVEKAFFFLNAQPTTASYADLYNFEKGDIGIAETTVTFQNFTVDGHYANTLAQKYLDAIMCNKPDHKGGAINVNSWKMDWSISSGSSTTKKVSQIKADNIRIA